MSVFKGSRYDKCTECIWKSSKCLTKFKSRDGQTELEPRCFAICWQCQDVDVQLPRLDASHHGLGQLAPCRNMVADTPHTALQTTAVYTPAENAYIG